MSSIAHLPNSAGHKFRIAIVGAGVGGLSAALSLNQRGFRTTLFERKAADTLRTEGVFLTLAPNGINALRAFGLADAVIAAGLNTTGLAIFNEHGKGIGSIDYGTHAHRFGAPSVTIRRGALTGVLLDAVLAAGSDLRLGCSVQSVSEDRDGVVLDSDGKSERFDLLVAADGLRSAVRTSLFPQHPAPHYTGLIGAGGWVDAPDVAPTGGMMRMSFGKRAFFGYMKLGDGPAYWFNSYPAAAPDIGAVGDPAAYARFVRELHAGDPLDNVAILAHVDHLERNYPIYDMPELPTWHTDHAVLLGDAAHAVAPHSGQGASMAIEDALVLAAALESCSGVQAALLQFEQLRRDRAKRAIEIGRMSGSQKHAQSWLMLRLRDLMLPLVMPMATKAQERMYGFRADLTPLAVPVQ